VDVALHSVYVTYQQDDGLFVVDTNVCNGSNLAACATLHPPSARTGASPEDVVLDQQTQTLYVANEADNDVSVIEASTCNARVTSGCRQDPPAAPVGWGVFTTQGLVADPAVGTLYATTANNAVSMVNTKTCNSHTSQRCAATPAQVTVGTNPNAVALDPLTHTVYVANFASGPGPSSVSVIDADTCNATDQAGCAELRTLQVPGGNADSITVDASTGTVYVATVTDDGPNLISVFNGATCNATDTGGCNQVPQTLEVGDSGGAFSNSELTIAVNQVTNTVYATNISGFYAGSFISPGLYMIDGATCDAVNTTGCGQTPVFMELGLSSASATRPGTMPWGLAVDEGTDTVYVALFANLDYEGAVAVVNGATCDGSDVTGCNQIAPLVAAGFASVAVAVDAFTHNVYTANLQDASVSVINGAICNGFVNFGCRQVAPKLPAGHYPASIVVDPAVGTVYAAGEDGISVLPLAP
jgi:DNA-binding beta-propeller fold protein YncE